jgi:hypothetical protein
MWVATYYFLAAIMDALSLKTGSALYEALLSNVFFGLYQAPTPVPTPAMVMAGITECNYDGYGRQAAVWFPTFLDASGPQDLAAQNMHFAPNDALVPNTATGAFMATAASGGILLLAAQFAVPIALPSPAYALNLAPIFQLAFTNNYGSPGVIA